MTYAEAEISVFAGSPVELYLFQTNAETWRITSADSAIDDDENEYTPLAMLRTSMGQSSEQSAGTLKVLLPASHPIAQRFIPFAPDTPMSLTIYRKHAGVDDRVTYWVGRVVSAVHGDDCELNCEPDSALLKKSIPPQLYQRPCTRTLYDAGCGMDPEDFKITATITSIDGSTIVSADFDEPPDQWLRSGYVEIGEQRKMVLDHQGDTVILLSPFIGVTAPVAANAFAGCNRSYADCNDKFENLKRFLGFPWIPARNPFNGLE